MNEIAGGPHGDDGADAGVPPTGATAREEVVRAGRRGRALVLAGRPHLADELRRICGAAGMEPDVVRSLVDAGSLWPDAPLVLLCDDEVVTEVLRDPPPLRSGIVLVGFNVDDAGIWLRGTRLGADHVAVFPHARGWLARRLSHLAEDAVRGAVRVAVPGGRGGAGATAPAVTLPLTASRSGRDTLFPDGSARRPERGSPPGPAAAPGLPTGFRLALPDAAAPLGCRDAA